MLSVSYLGLLKVNKLILFLWQNSPVEKNCYDYIPISYKIEVNEIRIFKVNSSGVITFWLWLSKTVSPDFW